MKKLIKQGSIISLLCCTGIIFSCILIRVNAQTDTLSPSKLYPYWPDYKQTSVEEIFAQDWSRKEGVKKGWDWSLPRYVSPSKNGLMALSRNIRRLPMPGFDVNAVVSIWFHWSRVEIAEGEYDWSYLWEILEKAEYEDYSVILRPITACWERKHINQPDHWVNQEPIIGPDYLVSEYGLKPRLAWSNKQGSQRWNLDPAHPEFHRAYLRLVENIGKSGLIKDPRVKGIIVGYGSRSWGDEGIGPHGKDLKPGQTADDFPHVIERLDAWARAAGKYKFKICMGGNSEHGLSLGFGQRSGFVEMYLYKIPQATFGQRIDEDGYLVTDESVPLLKNRSFLGDENEEYEPKWASAERKFRFGKTTESFTYRYFTSTLRSLQMQVNYMLHNEFSIYPEMTAYLALSMGKTAADSPDAWTFLRENHIRGKYYLERDDFKNRRIVTEEEIKNGVPVKNFERWLYQRDKDPNNSDLDYTTTAVKPIKMPVQQWMVDKSKDETFDMIARKGKNMGFAVDDRFVNTTPVDIALKITWFDESTQPITVKYHSITGKASREIKQANDRKLKTATIMLEGFTAPAQGYSYDFTLHSKADMTVSMVRIVKTKKP